MNGYSYQSYQNVSKGYMKEEVNKKLQQLTSALDKIGSGLDAIDKTGNWDYYTENQKKCRDLIDTLPKEIKKKLSSLKPDMHNCYRLKEDLKNIQT